MNEIEYNDILEKLSQQVKSFQDGFGILSGSSSLKELGNNFSRVIKMNFPVSNVNLFFKQAGSPDWEEISVHSRECLECLSALRCSSDPEIEYVDTNGFGIRATLPLKDGSYLGLILGNRNNESEITELDRITFQMFLQLLDNSYQSFINNQKEKQLNFLLKNKVLQLNSLIDTGIEISKLHKTSSLLELSLERAATLTNASYGALQVFHSGELLLALGFPGEQALNNISQPESRIETRIEFAGYEYTYILCDKESRAGVVPFESNDEILLEAFARQVLAALENEHLHKEAIVKERMHQEISTAASIQKRIIPQKLPEIDGYEVAGINIPSLEIGGDYYDIIKLKDGRFLIIIADVSGKGVASGLLVNTLNASLNAYLESEFHLSDAAYRLNKIIYRASTPEKYITGFIAILDPATGETEYLNAGHNPIFYYSDKKLNKLDKGGFAFGMLDMNLPYESGFITMKPGDRILFYTDGIPEAMDKDGNEYTDEKLENFFLKNKPSKASTFMKNLIADVKKHTADTHQSDDITALYLVRKAK